MSAADDSDDAKRRAALEITDDAVEALRRATLANDGLTRELAALKARFDVLVDALAAKEVLGPGHLKLMDNEARDASEVGPRPRVHLRIVEEHEIGGAEIDCAARLHLCHARCCTFQVTLSENELEAGLAWEIHEPYLLRRGVDGYCGYIDRGTAGCTVYERRPWECRIYDCRQDPRIWNDFEARDPAPLPSTFRPLPLRPRQENGS